MLRVMSSFFRGVHPRETGLGGGTLGLGIVLLRAGALQDEEVEGHERRTLEAQGPRPVGKLVGEVRARPVQHGHEVIGDDPDVARREVADRLFVILDIALKIARTGLDMLMDGNALHDRPPKACVGDRLPAFFDLPRRSIPRRWECGAGRSRCPWLRPDGCPEGLRGRSDRTSARIVCKDTWVSCF